MGLDRQIAVMGHFTKIYEATCSHLTNLREEIWLQFTLLLLMFSVSKYSITFLDLSVVENRAKYWI